MNGRFVTVLGREVFCLQYFFNFYFSDVIERTLELKAGCKLDAKTYNIIAYADDIALLAPSKTGLQLLIDNVSEFLAKINLCINAEKSSYIVFRSKKSKVPSTSVKLLGQPLFNVRECKYLGVMLTETLSIDKEIDQISSRFL